MSNPVIRLKIVAASSQERVTMRSDSLFNKYYPDDSRNGSLIFYRWLRTFVRPEFRVLNIGAGSMLYL